MAAGVGHRREAEELHREGSSSPAGFLATVAQAVVGLSQQRFAGRSSWTQGIPLDPSAPSRGPGGSSSLCDGSAAGGQGDGNRERKAPTCPLAFRGCHLPWLPARPAFKDLFQHLLHIELPSPSGSRLSPFRTEVVLCEVPPSLLGKASRAPALGAVTQAARGRGRRGTRARTPRERLYSGEASSHELRTSLANCFGVSLEMGAVSLACLGDSCGLGT